MRDWAVIGLLIGAAWYGIFRGAKGLVIKLYSYAISGMDLATNTLKLTLKILIKNPLYIGLTIKGVRGNVYAQGQKIGTVDTTYNYFLAGKKSHILPIVIDLDMVDSLQAAILNVQSGDVKTLTIAFDGELEIGKYGVCVPLKFELDYNDLTK